MSNYRRAWREAGTWFFTVALADRRSRLLVERIAPLRLALAHVQARHPFRVEAARTLLAGAATWPASRTAASARRRRVR
ncbi:MAG TPA: hypothetical protein VMM55_05115 [Thermohalobaculum sp.]|nr:hypothetical protein [Thermohalobaculum sp.]